MTIWTGNNTGDKFNTLYPNENIIDNLKDFSQAVSYDHTMCQFKDNKRENSRFIKTDCLYADIDNTHSENPEEWITIAKFQQLFAPYSYYLATSRSHQISKNGATPRDKFHVYFPIHEITDINKLTYWLEALVNTYPFFDQAVKDAARFFFGNTSSIIKKGIGNKSIIEALKGYKPKQEEKRLPHISEIGPGNRNDSFFRYACSLHNGGATDDEIRLFFDTLPVSPKLSDHEIDTILRSVNRFQVTNIKQLPDKEYIKNYYSVDTGDKDQDGNSIYKTTYYDDFAEFDSAAQYFISLRDGSGKKFLLDAIEPETMITKPAELIVKLMSKKVYLDFKPNGLGQIEYLEWLKENSKVIERISITPETQVDTRTKYIYPHLSAEKTGYFRGLIDIMTFKSLKDRYRFAAGLLSMFLPASFDGRKPLFSILADSPSSGKTAAARIAIKCCQGMRPIEFTGDKEDEQQLSGILPLSNKAVLYDNLQYIERKQLLNITKAVTDEWIPAWFFGISHARVRNNKTFFATFNTEESINGDVLNRIVTIHMKDGRDMKDSDRLQIQALINKITSNKDKVQQDIRWALEQPSKPVAIKHHPKFAEWGVQVTKLLQHFFPEVDEFDFSLSEEDKELSSDTVLFDEFMQELLGNSNAIFISNSDLVEKYRVFYHRNAASTREVTQRIKNMKKSFTHKYTIETNVCKTIAKITMKGIEIELTTHK